MNKNLTWDTEESYLSQGYKFIIGCDEVGRGCLAGPVVAAAVTVKDYKFRIVEWKDIKDSKLLSPKKRTNLVALIKQNFVWSISEVDEKVIDEINILQASLLAMRKAVDELHTKLDHYSGELLTTALVKEEGRYPQNHASLQNKNRSMLLIDGSFKLPSYTYPQTAIVDGDVKVFSIAAASIIAKVYRDELMRKLDTQFPGYDLARHKGYGTKIHRNAIHRLGPSLIHRKSFKLL